MILINKNNFSKIIKNINNNYRNNKKTIKIGIDTNKPFIHIGHYSIIRFIKFIKKIKLIIILGDFTASIKNNNKKNNILLHKNNNNSNYIKNIIKKLLKINRYKIIKNSNWLLYNNNFNYKNFNIKELIKKKRYYNNNIYINNILYPYYQSIDSTIINNKIELGGKDQINNFKIDKKINKNKYILFPILKTKYNNKISKSNNKEFIIKKNIYKLYNNLKKKPIITIKNIFNKLFNIKKYIYKKLKISNKKNIIISILIDIYGFKKIINLIKNKYINI